MPVYVHVMLGTIFEAIIVLHFSFHSILWPHLLLVILNSGGPLPEELLPRVKCPVRILWGENDPWEPIEQGT